jgi:acyl-coenzyme A synthetase/AMP-(fatty) acid ligase
LLTVPGAIDAAAIGLDDVEFEQMIGAFVVLSEKSKLDLAEIRAAVRDSLANYKVPKRLSIVDEIPRNTTGKIMRRAIAARLGWADVAQ